MRPRYEDMTSEELAAERANLDRVVAVVPIAAVEQHGPHLPLGTDAMLADGMVETVLSMLPAERPVTFLRTVRIGKSLEHARLSGTLSHNWKTATSALIEIGESLAATGFRRLVIVNAHGGNTPVMDTAALELRRAHGVLAATCSWLRFGVPDGLLPAQEVAVGIHGGAVETSLMLHFRPELVRDREVGDFASLQADLEASAKQLRAHGRLGFGWMAEDLNPAGVVGNATLASAEIGRAIAAYQARAFVDYLDDVLAFDLSRLR